MELPKDRKGSVRAAERRLALVQAAYHSIAEQGLKGLRTREVAAQVGMTHATLHYYFPTKEALIQAVVDYAVFQRILASDWTAPYVPSYSGTPREQLHWFLQDMEQRLLADPTTFLVLYELLRHAQHDPAIRDLFLQQKLYGNWHSGLSALFEAGVAQGQFRADLNMEVVASTLMTLILGLGLTLLAPVPSSIKEMFALFEYWLTSEQV